MAAVVASGYAHALVSMIKNTASKGLRKIWRRFFSSTYGRYKSKANWLANVCHMTGCDPAVH